jgi:GDP-L-fucose synthase
MREDSLLTGPLEPTSEAFAVAKIAGIKSCQYYNRQYKTDFISVIPATVYGKGDDFDPKASHVIPALIRKFAEADKKRRSAVTIWGSGRPRREFLHVDDMTDAVIFLMNNANTPELVNIGTGTDISVRELAELLKEITGFKGLLKFEARYPDGAYRKLLDVRKLKSLGWRARINLRRGLEEVYRWYCRRDNASKD